jgi:putative SOS response-associated peptidase YedK
MVIYLMCGRFDCHSDISVILKVFTIDRLSIEYQPHYNIAPSQNIIVIKDSGQRELIQCRWGFLPSWAKDPAMGFKMINARAESVADKPAFQDAFKYQRCLVPADGFFEWVQEGKVKQPVYIRLKSHTPVGFAGLYSVWRSPDGEDICTCTIITTDANEVLRPIHDRMPVIIPKDKEDLWLDPKIGEKEKLMPLLMPYPSDEMEFYRVSPVMNKLEYDSPDVLMTV